MNIIWAGILKVAIYDFKSIPLSVNSELTTTATLIKYTIIGSLTVRISINNKFDFLFFFLLFIHIVPYFPLIF